MNIAFLTPEFPSSRFGHSGGIGTSIKNLSNGLLTRGHKVLIIIYGRPKDEIIEEDGLLFYCVKNIKVKGLSLYLTQKKLESLINSLVKKGEIDIVEAPDWTGISSFIKPKCPLVIRLNGSDTYFCKIEGRKVKKVNRFLEKRALQKANSIVSVSAYTANLTNSIFNLNRNISVIPNSIDCSNFRYFNSQSEGNNVILYFGTLIRKKGLLELPHVFNIIFEKNNQAKLVLIGKDSFDIKTNSNSTWDLMKPLFNNEALNNVSYLGKVSHSEINSYINNADVCVFPTFAEALPVSWLEAMAVGKAIVASNIGWGNEIIDNGIDGFLSHPTDHNGFATNVLKLLEDKQLSKSMSIQARKKVENRFDVEVVVDQNLAFYKSVINNFSL